MTFEYDDLADVLFVSFQAPNGKCFYTYSSEGSILSVDSMSGEIVGVEILAFARKAQSGPVAIPELQGTDFSITCK